MTTVDDADLAKIRSDYQKALRAWHVAWMARVDRHREHFYPLTDREQSLLYEHVLEERQQLKDAEERAYDRFLRAMDVLAEALPLVDPCPGASETRVDPYCDPFEYRMEGLATGETLLSTEPYCWPGWDDGPETHDCRLRVLVTD